MAETFEERYDRLDDTLKWEDVPNKLSKWRDMHAMRILESVSSTESPHRMVSVASHDQVWFDVSDEDLEKLTDQQIAELSACGLFPDIDGGLTMFA